MRLVLIMLMTALAGPALLAASNEKDMESFQFVWETIRDKHWDLEGTGVDWQAVYEKYKPRVEASESRTETRALLTEMLGELGQSHFRILEEGSSKALEALAARFPSGAGQPGFKVALVEDRVFIVKIDENSDSASKGLGIGAEILNLRGEDMGEIVSEMNSAFENTAHKGLYMSRMLNEFFTGSLGSKLALKVKVNDKVQKVKVELERPPGRFMPLLNLPSIYYDYQSKVLPNNIGYIYFNIFTLDSKKAFEEDLLGPLKHTDGLIIDMRGNPGGLGLTAVGFAGRLVSERGKRLGQMSNSGGTLNFAIFPQSPVYEKPVAILIDEGSASTSEILAAGLQDLKRARLFGSRSAGAALPSMIEDLPNGDRFQFAIADYISYEGRYLEGVGVIPDETTPHTLDSMARKVDAAREAAVIWIKKQTKSTGAKNESL